MEQTRDLRSEGDGAGWAASDLQPCGCLFERRYALLSDQAVHSFAYSRANQNPAVARAEVKSLLSLPDGIELPSFPLDGLNEPHAEF